MTVVACSVAVGDSVSVAEPVWTAPMSVPPAPGPAPRWSVSTCSGLEPRSRAAGLEGDRIGRSAVVGQACGCKQRIGAHQVARAGHAACRRDVKE